MRKWETVDFNRSRVPERAVAAFLDRLETERCQLHGFAMLDGGRILAEGYWAPFTPNSLHRMYSAGKSFVSLAVGLLQEEDKLALDHDICRYFPEKCPKEGVPPWLAEMTIRQMLTMTTCHRKTTYKQYKGDWVESFFRVEPTNLPGAVFSYDTSATHVLSALVEKLSGRKLMDYLREKCFDRIGVSKEAYFLCDPAGTSQGGSGLNCTLRDLLAVAELVMNGGVYQGERLLPKDYIREATGCQVPTLHQPVYDEQFGYGYQIWRGRHDSFYFYGIGGQLAVCLPDKSFILVTMGDTLDNKNGIKDIFDAFFELIYPWLESCEDGRLTDNVFPKQEAGVELARGQDGAYERREEGLAEKLSKLTLAKRYPWASGAGNNAVKAVEKGRHWAGKTYHFAENVLQISLLRVDLDRDRGTFFIVKEGRDFEMAFGADTYVRQRFPWAEEDLSLTGGAFAGNGVSDGEEPETAPGEGCCQGTFINENMLFLRCCILGPDMATLTVVLHFQASGVTIKMQKGADDSLKNFEGVASST